MSTTLRKPNMHRCFHTSDCTQETQRAQQLRPLVEIRVFLFVSFFGYLYPNVMIILILLL